MWRAFQSAVNHSANFDRQTWLLVLLGVAAFGFFLMRGFGRRGY